MTRTVNPPLPYVKPANVQGEPDEGASRTAARIEEIEAELQRLREMIERLRASEGNAAAIKRLEQRVALIEREMGVQQGSTPPSGPSPEVDRQPVPSVGDDRQAAAPQPESGPPAQGLPPRVEILSPQLAEDEKAFRDAYILVQRGALNEAAPLLKEFLKNHPKSPQASDALYWLGEALYSKGKYDEAVLYFDRVIKEYPEARKKLSALLKQGLAFAEMNDPQSARIILEKLIKESPHSPQARTANAKLKELQKK
jgi:tol-pal system protein YbgF